MVIFHSYVSLPEGIYSIYIYTPYIIYPINQSSISTESNSCSLYNLYHHFPTQNMPESELLPTPQVRLGDGHPMDISSALPEVLGCIYI